MKIVDRRNTELSRLVKEVLVYPYLSSDAVEPELAFSGYIAVRKETDEEEVKIQFNIQLKTMTIAHFDRFQQALSVVRKLANVDLLTNPDAPLPDPESTTNAS